MTPKDAATPSATATAEPVAPPTPPAAMPMVPVTNGKEPKVPVAFGLAPKTLDEGWRLAQAFARSELVPKNFRNKPEDILVAMQMGMELGLAPLQSLASIAVINGRASIWGDGFLALIMASPLYQDHDEYYEVDGTRRDGLTVEDLKKDSTVAVCTFWRHGKQNPVTRRFSIGQARKAALLGKEGPWGSYPDRMLSMRARSFAGRDAFPDLLRGIKTAEEVIDTPAEDYTVEPLREVRRISETPAGATPVTATVIPGTTFGPAKVENLEPFLGGFLLTLVGIADVIEVTEGADAMELEKFKGTDHKINVLTERIGTSNKWALKSFSIAD